LDGNITQIFTQEICPYYSSITAEFEESHSDNLNIEKRNLVILEFSWKISEGKIQESSGSKSRIFDTFHEKVGIFGKERFDFTTKDKDYSLLTVNIVPKASNSPFVERKGMYLDSDKLLYLKIW